MAEDVGGPCRSCRGRCRGRWNRFAAADLKHAGMPSSRSGHQDLLPMLALPVLEPAEHDMVHPGRGAVLAHPVRRQARYRQERLTRMATLSSLSLLMVLSVIHRLPKVRIAACVLRDAQVAPGKAVIRRRDGPPSSGSLRLVIQPASVREWPRSLRYLCSPLQFDGRRSCGCTP